MFTDSLKLVMNIVFILEEDIYSSQHLNLFGNRKCCEAFLLLFSFRWNFKASVILFIFFPPTIGQVLVITTSRVSNPFPFLPKVFQLGLWVCAFIVSLENTFLFCIFAAFVYNSSHLWSSLTSTNMEEFLFLTLMFDLVLFGPQYVGDNARPRCPLPEWTT